MAAVQRKLVHRQFNSPMGLYSQENVKATLDRELKAFGAEGLQIDENITKSSNLVNSAVLRAVEEDDQIKCGYKRVAWPPLSEERIIREFTPQPKSQSPGPTQYYQQETLSQIQQQQQKYPTNISSAQHNPQYPPQQYSQRQYSQPQYTHQQYNTLGPCKEHYEDSIQHVPHQSIEPRQQSNSPYQYQSNQFKQINSNLPDLTSSHGGWKSIQPPIAKIENQFHGFVEKTPNQYQQRYSVPQQYQAEPQQYQHQYLPNTIQKAVQPQQQSTGWNQQHNADYQPQAQITSQDNKQSQSIYSSQSQHPSNLPEIPGSQYNFSSQGHQQSQFSLDQIDLEQRPLQTATQNYHSGSPGIIALRKETPITQKSAPVYTSQPAAVNYKGGSKMRGDLKWPPPEYKEAAARENEERRKLALGPVCRPRKVNRDYTPFFAKHALNSTYPSYKVPPGTQHIL